MAATPVSAGVFVCSWDCGSRREREVERLELRLGRRLQKLIAAMTAAEVPGFTLLHSRDRRRRIDSHTADRIDRHGNSPCDLLVSFQHSAVSFQIERQNRKSLFRRQLPSDPQQQPLFILALAIGKQSAATAEIDQRKEKRRRDMSPAFVDITVRESLRLDTYFSVGFSPAGLLTVAGKGPSSLASSSSSAGPRRLVLTTFPSRLTRIIAGMALMP